MMLGGSGRSVANGACPESPTCCVGNGYFGPVMVVYVIGLDMANMAVYVMEMGQPALLYLVPCCLGTMVYTGKKAGELADLWEGPRAICSCETLMYGDAPQVESAVEADQEQDLELEESINN